VLSAKLKHMEIAMKEHKDKELTMNNEL